MSRKHGLRQAVRRMQRSGMSAAFGAWAMHAQESRKLLAASARVVARMLRSQYVSSFDRWLEYAEQRRRLRKVTTHATGRLLNMRASMALSAWVEAVDMWQMERGDAAQQLLVSSLRADLEAQRDRAVAQIVSRWQQQGMSKCFLS